MHELSLAEAIVHIAARHAGERRVARIDVKVGHLRQVVPSALEFAFELVSEGTVLAGAELVLEEVPAAGRCRACGSRNVLDEFPLTCRACGGLDVDVVAGEELLVESLEPEEPVPASGR